MKPQVKNLKSIVVVILLVITTASLNAQETNKSALYPGFGIGFGFFYPGDINDYLAETYVSYETINMDMYMYYPLQAFLTYKIKRFDVTGIVEYATGPKYEVTYSDWYFFNRFSPGVVGNIFFPVGSGKHAFYAGLGAQYHIMTFEEFSASNIGFRLQGGFSLQFGKINLQPHFALNIVSADDDSSVNNKFNLNYTGGQIGVNVSFHKPVAYR